MYKFKDGFPNLNIWIFVSTMKIARFGKLWICFIKSCWHEEKIKIKFHKLEPHYEIYEYIYF